MGYEYTIHGWYKSDHPVELSTVRPSGACYSWTDEPPIDRYVCVTGRERNYVVFATQANHRSNYYLAVLSAIMASSGRSGNGLITITGEITYDGKDRFVIARDGTLFTLPTARVYDPISPWNAVYRWSHYMARQPEDLIPPDAAMLRALLAGRTSVKGSLYLHDHNTSDAEANRIIAGIVDREPQLDGGIAFLDLFLQPYLLFGADDVDAASAVAMLAELTANNDRAYGMLYCSAGDESSQTPVCFENGRVRVLPEVSLAPGAERVLPTPQDAYEGLGDGSEYVAIRSSHDLHALFRQVATAVSAEPLEPSGGWRDQTKHDVECYVFETNRLACVLMKNVFTIFEGWPFVLATCLQGEANPPVLKSRVAGLVTRLRAGGIEVAAEH